MNGIFKCSFLLTVLLRLCFLWPSLESTGNSLENSQIIHLLLEVTILEEVFIVFIQTLSMQRHFDPPVENNQPKIHQGISGSGTVQLNNPPILNCPWSKENIPVLELDLHHRCITDVGQLVLDVVVNVPMGEGAIREVKVDFEGMSFWWLLKVYHCTLHPSLPNPE